LNVTAIETMVTFQFDGTPLLRLSIQVIEGSKECNIVHTIMQMLNRIHWHVPQSEYPYLGGSRECN